MQKLLNFFKKIDLAFARCVQSLLIILIMAMMFLVAGQVILRNIFSSGIAWADVASRHMVLWAAFLGAMLATRSRQHIAIDALTRLFPRKSRNFIRIGLDLLACFVAFLLAKAAYAFVLDEKAMGTMLFANVPTWIAQIIIPFGFAMISLEYAIGVGLDIWRIYKDGSKHVAGKGRV
ncbi:MAG: TRAP transporter small permease [Pseudomonadota bacterium]